MSSYISLVFNYLFRSSDYLNEQQALLVGLQSAPSQPRPAQMAVRSQQQPQQALPADSWCVALARLAGSTLRSFGDFEALLRQQHINASWLKTGTNRSEPTWPQQQQHQSVQTIATTGALQVASQANAPDKQTFQQVNQLEALECFNELQLRDYYQSYDILVGLRIASSLTILFIVFILFVIYKTGCRDNGNRPSRSQLQLSRAGPAAGASAQKPTLENSNSLNNNNNSSTNHYASGHINQLA